jgi:hypothetical protein
MGGNLLARVLQSPHLKDNETRRTQRFVTPEGRDLPALWLPVGAAARREIQRQLIVGREKGELT